MKTKDEQDTLDPFKPFPNREYFDNLYQAWDTESVLFIEKSRSLMATWWGAAICTHWMMTHPASRVLFMAQDEDRALQALGYCWILYESQDEALKQVWPLDRPRSKQSYNVIEFANKSSGWAIPGKDTGKIRSEHPTIVFFDEAAHIEKFDDALNNALSARTPKIVAVTSAEPGSFREITRPAEPIVWPYEKPPVKGVTIRRIPEGFPCAGAAVLRLHYSADPSFTEEKIAAAHAKAPSEALWAKELEIEWEALEGSRVYPEFKIEQNVCDPFDVSDPAQWTIWHACDPHMRTPHAFAWEAFNKEGDSVLCGELWTKNHYWGCKEWAETIAWLESDSMDKPESWDWARGKKLRIAKRVMDTHGAAANSEEGPDFFAAYRQHGLNYEKASKGQQILAAARDRIGAAFLPQLAYQPDGTPFLQPKRHIFRTCKEAIYEYQNVRYPEGDIERPSQERPKTYTKHILDCASYIWTGNGRYIERSPERTLFESTYQNIAY